jgi:hypothetical protein
MMGGAVDFAALPIICEMLGIEDVEMLVQQLIVIRESKR